MNTRLLSCLLALTLNLTALAQDKPGADQQPAPVPSSFRQAEHQWEMEAHTTDCSKAPTRTIASDCGEVHRELHTVALQNAAVTNDANEILVALRNMSDPSDKIFLIQNQNLISIQTYPQQFARMEAYIHTVDRPHIAYKLTFTLVESDNGKRIGIEHYSMTAVSGQRTSVKQGSKVPIETTGAGEGSSAQQQFEYLDVGLSFDVTPLQVGPNISLKLKVEQSSLGEPRPIFGDREPVIRQAVFEGVATVVPGKPTTIGSLDTPNSTRHVDIEVLAEPRP